MPRKNTDPPAPWLRPHHILITPDVRRLCGGISRSTLIAWRQDRGFPEPVRSIRTGRGVKAQRVDVWDRRDVMLWLKENPGFSREIEPEEMT